MRTKKAPALVTRDTIKTYLTTRNRKDVEKFIGRALLVLLARQTSDEQSSHVTMHHNGVGFAGCDAETGTKCAKHYQEKGWLFNWMIDAWSREGSTGFPRLAKYHAQLNEAALAKQAAESTILKVA